MTAGTLFIQVLGTKYALRFGYAALRQLGVLWQVDGLQDVFSRLGKLGELSDGKLNFEALDLIGDIALAAIDATGVDHELNREVLVDHFITHNDDLMAVVDAFVKSMPQGDTAKKKNPAPRKKVNKKK